MYISSSTKNIATHCYSYLDILFYAHVRENYLLSEVHCDTIANAHLPLNKQSHTCLDYYLLYVRKTQLLDFNSHFYISLVYVIFCKHFFSISMIGLTIPVHRVELKYLNILSDEYFCNIYL